MKFGSFNGFRGRGEKQILPQEKLAEKNEILGEWDHKILEQGLTNILSKMYADFGNDLPDTIVLPDTAARPLLFALKPTFEAIEKAGSASQPHIYFFRSTKPPIQLSAREGRNGEIRTEEEFRALQELGNEEAKQWGGERSSEELDLELANARPEDMTNERLSMQNRAEEISAFEEKRLGHPARIAVIDEYATESADTMRELRRAFQNELLPFYTVFAQSDDTTTGQIIDPFDLNDTNPQRNHSANFSYRGTPSIGVKKTEFKSNIYSDRIDATRPEEKTVLSEQKKQLRDEMKQIGEKIASNILSTSIH